MGFDTNLLAIAVPITSSMINKDIIKFYYVAKPTKANKNEIFSCLLNIALSVTRVVFLTGSPPSRG
jgi:hypothetical protein